MLGSKKKKAFVNHHSLLSPSTRVVGDLHFSGDFYLEGAIKGNIYAEDGKPAKLIITHSGFVEGDIRAPNIIVNGKVSGTIYSSKHIELSAKAIVEGSIHYQLIEMVKGSQLRGQLICTDTGPAKPAVTDTKPQAAKPATR